MEQREQMRWTVQQLETILRKHFGHQAFRKYQLDVIQSVLSGRDALLVQSTGGGKSLCFQLPSLLLPRLTIVVSPLISLMDDQVSAARAVGRKDTIAIHGAMELEKREWLIKQLHQFRLVYISPEGLQRPQVLNALRKRGVSLFVVDEAHCISQWGHDFRLDYQRLATIRRQFGNPTCLALTATAPPEVRQDIINCLQMEDPAQFIYSVDRENIAIKVESVQNEADKWERVYSFIQHRQDAGMIYCMSRQKTEELCARLKQSGIHNTAYYHGGMSAEDRTVIQQQFLAGRLKVICATNAFGMGINKENIRYVIHYHFPSHLEAYVQEIGRCSRDGKEGLSYVLYQAEDEQIHHQLLEQERVTLEQVEHFIALYRTSLQRRNDEQNMYQMIGCTEQALDMMKFHLDALEKQGRYTDRQISRVIYQQLERQWRKKQKHVEQIRRWLQLNNVCRRSALLRYFSESDLHTKIRERCCDGCGLKKNDWMQDVDIQNTDEWCDQPLSGQDWQNKLLRLLPCEGASAQGS